MAVHVLHLGMDDCHRVAVLRSVGYRVEECSSLMQLETALKQPDGADALFLAESEGMLTQKAVLLARERPAVPVILFRRSTEWDGEDDFDLVIPPLTAPEQWLEQVGSLLEWSRAVREQGRAIVRQARALRKEASALRLVWEKERERAQHERARNAGMTASDAWRTPEGGS